jgi:hypothetical protein
MFITKLNAASGKFKCSLLQVIVFWILIFGHLNLFRV